MSDTSLQAISLKQSGQSQPALDQGRASIARIDRSLVRLIARRTRLARRIGRAKKSAGLPALDPAREAEVVRHAAVLARDAGLPEEEVRDVFWRLIALCRNAQSEDS
jgi:chorismate mutase